MGSVESESSVIGREKYIEIPRPELGPLRPGEGSVGDGTAGPTGVMASISIFGRVCEGSEAFELDSLGVVLLRKNFDMMMVLKLLDSREK